MKSHFLWVSLVLISVWGCQNTAKTDLPEGQNTIETAEEAPQNVLTETEKADGWRLLFDGTTGKGWHTYLTDSFNWKIENGELFTTGNLGDLTTDATFQNFELSIDWKIEPEGNSGIFFNVVESEDYPYTFLTAPEFQILDDENYPQPTDATQKSGANYALHPPSERVSNPAGTYNRARIIVQNGQVQHFLNGKKIVEYDLWTADWDALVAQTKFKDMPAYGKAKSGKIALQDHGNKVWFRNIKIKVL